MYGPYVIASKQDRRVMRRAVRVRCEVVAEDGFRLLGGRTLDLSEEGLLLRSGADADVGEAVFVSLRPPGNDRWWIDAEGIVTRVVSGRRQGDPGRAIGVRFVRMDPSDRALLSGSLRGHPPPVPLRHLRRDYARTIQLAAAS